MTKIIFSRSLAGALFSLCLAAMPATAASPQTYVSGKGADTGACATPATACRTFAFAIGQTTASGEIKAIDPANYGPLTITKSISIVADGAGPAGIVLTAGTAITINAGAGDIVNLRGLTLDGTGTADHGIDLTSAGSLTIADCFVRHFKLTSISLIPSGAMTFLVSNTTVTNSLGLRALGGAVKGVIDHVTAIGGDADIGAIVILARGPKVDVTILNSVMSNNNTSGLFVEGGAGGANVYVRNSVANHNGFAGFALNGATLRLADSTATGNFVGISLVHGGKVLSYGDNEIDGNSVNVSGGNLSRLGKR